MTEEIAQVSAEQLEAGGNVGNKVVGSKESNVLTHQISSTTSASLIYMDEYDTCVAILNIVGSLYCRGLFILSYLSHSSLMDVFCLIWIF